MNIRYRILVPATAVVLAAAVVGILAAHIYGKSAAASGGRGATLTAAGVAARPPLQCGQGEEAAMGYVGIDISSQISAAGNTSGGVLTQITDSATGQVLTLTRSPGESPALERSRDSSTSAWLPVYPLATQGDLRSCQLTLADRPAAKPIIDSAMTALVQAGYFPSLPELEAQLQVALISDDPATPGSVIVTILVPGPVYEPAVPPGASIGPHPALHSLTAYTALEVAATATVVGVASGGF